MKATFILHQSEQPITIDSNIESIQRYFYTVSSTHSLLLYTEVSRNGL